MNEIREQLKSMSLPDILALLFKVGKIGKDVWDNLKDFDAPKLKWRRSIVETLNEKDVEILALKMAVKKLSERLDEVEQKAG